jgi:hypothetical protein
MTPMQLLNHLEREGDSTHKAILVYLNQLATFQQGPTRHTPSKGVSVSLFFLHDIKYCINFIHSFIYSYLQTHPAAADIGLAAAAVDNSLTNYTSHSASGVSISDDAEGNIKSVLGEEISDVVEASAPTDASAVMMAPAMLAAAVSSVVAAVAAKKGGVSGLIDAIFSMNLYIL